MHSFNPYLIDEIVTQSGNSNNYFGLIGGSESNRTELHGYEITMSGKLVLPELKQKSEQEEQKLIQAILC
ncbi:MAG: hypothetical protein AB7P14_10590 [Blastocatellales bacterium]